MKRCHYCKKRKPLWSYHKLLPHTHRIATDQSVSVSCKLCSWKRFKYTGKIIHYTHTEKNRRRYDVKEMKILQGFKFIFLMDSNRQVEYFKDLN